MRRQYFTILSIAGLYLTAMAVLSGQITDTKYILQEAYAAQASGSSGTNVTVVVLVNGTEVFTLMDDDLPVVCGVDWINLGDPRQPMNC
jgi:hypothetical protein